jgi:hypothetical protein
MSRSVSQLLIGVGLVFFLCACATARKANERDPGELLEEVCSIGAQNQTVQGSLWLKADSAEAKGQFPADVKMDGPGNLRMEVTNMLGGTEAVIEVQGDRYSVKSPRQGASEQKGKGTWGGIPLSWASALVLGRMPCPTELQKKGAKIEALDAETLQVSVSAGLGRDAETFRYKLRSWAGKLWPFQVEWEKLGPFGNAVSFEFEDPEDGTRVPRRWSAKSKAGSVKVRWKSRSS